MKASDAAYEVLAGAGEPLHVKVLCERMVADGLWETASKTPWDALSAVLGSELNSLGVASRLSRPSANPFVARKPGDRSLDAAQEDTVDTCRRRARGQ